MEQDNDQALQQEIVSLTKNRALKMKNQGPPRQPTIHYSSRSKAKVVDQTFQKNKSRKINQVLYQIQEDFQYKAHQNSFVPPGMDMSRNQTLENKIPSINSSFKINQHINRESMLSYLEESLPQRAPDAVEGSKIKFMASASQTFDEHEMFNRKRVAFSNDETSSIEGTRLPQISKDQQLIISSRGGMISPKLS